MSVVTRPNKPKPKPVEGGAWHWHIYQAEWTWCAYPEQERCGGIGYQHCHCAGDFCCCGNGGEIECDGCPDCEGDDDAS